MGKKPLKTESLGERIRQMRKKQNIDLETLAEKLGQPVDFLQQIEEGKTSPPVGALIQISRALSMESGELLSEGRRQERRKGYRKRTKAYKYKTLTPEAEDNHLWAYQVTLDPKQEHERVEYKHEGEEFVYVLEGRVEIRVGDEKHILRKGSSLHFNSAAPHTLTNLSKTEAKLIVVVYAP